MLRLGAMEWFFLFLVFMSLVILVTQVVIPALQERNLFPAFRKKATKETDDA